jgi:murein DD-endopeptidase MepM/ murein hydrolase activator NlpD
MLKRVMSWLSKRVTFLVDAGSYGKVKRLAIPRWGLSAVVLVFALLIGFAGLSIAYRASEQVDYERLAHLEENNKLLEAQYKHLSEEIDSLKVLLGLLGKHDLQLRVQANMEVLPEDVRRLGVGGQKQQAEELAHLKKIRSKQYQNVAEVSNTVDELLRKAKYQRESFEEINEKLKKDKHLRDHTPSIRPCNGWQCSGFGYRIDPFTKRPRRHNGLDISNAPGTPIIATADGVVSYTGARSGYGLCIKIDHGSEIETFFAHLASIFVKPGEEVVRGQVVATMGATGRTSGTHLHYEVRVGGKPVNPLNYIIDEGEFEY